MSGPGGRSRGWIWYLFAALAVVAFVQLLVHRWPGSLDVSGDGPQLAYLLALLVLLGGGFFIRVAQRPSAALQQAGIWVGIGLV